MLRREVSLRPRPSPSWHPGARRTLQTTETRLDCSCPSLGVGRAHRVPAQQGRQALGGCSEARAQLPLQRPAARPPASFGSRPGLPAPGGAATGQKRLHSWLKQQSTRPCTQLDVWPPLLYCGLYSKGSRKLTRMLENPGRIGWARCPTGEQQVRITALSPALIPTCQLFLLPPVTR